MDAVYQHISQLCGSDGLILKDVLTQVLIRVGLSTFESAQLCQGVHLDVNGYVDVGEFFVNLQSSKLENTEENGNKVIADKLSACAAKWAKLNEAAVPPPVGTRIPFAVVADQDEASRRDSGWLSHLALCNLTYRGNFGQESYAFDFKREADLFTTRGDKADRGAEYSTLEVFRGKLLAACDRTGNLDELLPQSSGKTFDVAPLLGAEGPTVLRMGDGKKDKPLKCEWSSQKGGKLYIGSTGKERTDHDGNVVHEGEMWVKCIDPNDFFVEHLDWRSMYTTLRKAANCPHGAGYMVHESARWSDVHKMWFFLPRKLSRQAYDETIDAGKCVNLMLAAPENPSESDVIMQSYLTMSPQRGCSDFVFIPGTGDCHILVIRTNESLDNELSTLVSVIDLEANVLMPEQLIAKDRKFEGLALLDGFMSVD
eukprot:TRINITY_DN103336_c0_g1_i1.p1 TRINITY_DN103336_c0_g1~~TRINITY_DN103336_c0_g1_i1.p1  ORF type:complete len:426 (+),score=75.85 TRINITY_DN103336_c0_g1_i1:161-1438(+)